MADATGQSWQRIARELAPRLPGSWVTARSGIGTILVRQPVGWTLDWVGASRIRKNDVPKLMGGDASFLDGPFTFSVGNGLNSDARLGKPGTIDLTAPGAEAAVEEFVVTDLLPRLERWPASKLAEAAEAQLAQPPAERERPFVYQTAAGWRVVRDTGSPVEPAEEAATWLKEAYAPQDAVWFASLADAWRSGGRELALEFLRRQRQQALEDLKLSDIQLVD